MENETKFTTEISSKHRLFDLHLRETLHYRDLIFLFVKRDFTALYKQTILGPLWAVIQPLFTTIVFNLVFGRLADLSTADIPGDFIIPSFLFYMVGNVCWGYFSTTLQAISNTFLYNSTTMGKVYYPRLVVPISSAISRLIPFAIQLTMMFGVWAFYLIVGGTSICVTPMLLMIPVCILQMMLLAIGIGIIISAATTKYRDLTMAFTFCVTLWQYATPIAYGLALVPERLAKWYMLNPVTPIIAMFRYAVFGFGYFDWMYYLISWGITLAVFFVGLILFSCIERTFTDTI